ncbi:perlucin-like protein [Asterias amurensis]|uniref:perlucin-like protein n=1 Tax=Asterias amurensis TaxID=7602 RepID=UPI003AB4AB59
MANHAQSCAYLVQVCVVTTWYGIIYQTPVDYMEWSKNYTMASQHFLMTKMFLLYLMPAFAQASQSCVSSTGAGKCPNTWRQRGDNCYEVTSTDKSWSEAKEECKQMSSVMSTPNSMNETLFLLGMVSTDRLWIDCYYNDNQQEMECKDGMRVIQYNGWEPGEPNGHSTEPCGEIVRGSGKWNDNRCDLSYLAICKRPVPAMLHL